MASIKKTIAFVSFFVVAVAVAGAATLWIAYRDLVGFSRAPFKPDDKAVVVIEIPKGSSPKKIGTILEDNGIISDSVMFDRYLRFARARALGLAAPQMKAGEYELSSSMPPEAVIQVLVQGKQREFKFTVPEGIRKEEVAKIIAAADFGLEADILAAMERPSTIKAFGVPARGAGGQDGVPGGIEGYLYPDTYQFPRGTPIEDILLRMRVRLDEVIDEEMKAQMQKMGWDLHKVLTLAAIVEKETADKSERTLIAGLFLNRIQLGMKLQTDPTIVYGIKNYDGNIRKSDILAPHPYNTYVISGLPPGPIAQPGREAIHAVLFPMPSKNLFFVSKNNGSHVFCPDLACHNAAVQKWQVEYFRGKR